MTSLLESDAEFRWANWLKLLQIPQSLILYRSPKIVTKFTRGHFFGPFDIDYVLRISQVVMIHILQPKGREFESTYVLVLFCFVFFYLLNYSIRLTSFIIDVPRPLSNVFWIIIFKRLMHNAYTEPVCLEHLRASK